MNARDRKALAVIAKHFAWLGQPQQLEDTNKEGVLKDAIRNFSADVNDVKISLEEMLEEAPEGRQEGEWGDQMQSDIDELEVLVDDIDAIEPPEPESAVAEDYEQLAAELADALEQIRTF